MAESLPQTPPRLIIAGGGTGGHLFPGVAVAEELLHRFPNAQILFVGTEKGIEARVVPKLGYALRTIEISGVKTVGLAKAVKGFSSLPRSFLQSRRIIKEFGADAILGVGGYASFPVVFMGQIMGKRTAVLEQNSLPGLANKVLGKLVDRAFLAFDESRKYFPSKKIVMSGNPIRRTILASLAEPQGTSAKDEENTLSILVVGGSQGAAAINRLVPPALKSLRDCGITVSCLHQTGAGDVEKTLAEYQALGLTCDVRPFIEDMASAYSGADLVIARSGATTVAELGIVGKPAIFVPFPFAADNHQEVNAQEMTQKGAALMFRQKELTAQTLADAIMKLAREPKTLAQMAARMKMLGKPDAGAVIVSWLLEA